MVMKGHSFRVRIVAWAERREAWTVEAFEVSCSSVFCISFERLYRAEGEEIRHCLPLVLDLRENESAKARVADIVKTWRHRR